MAAACVIAGWLLGRRSGRASVVIGARSISDGVPAAPLEDTDDVHHVGRTGVHSARVMRIRMPSSPTVVRSDRLARGSTPPPFARVAAGELEVRELTTPAPHAKRATTDP
jgi:hypothetical protein